ncbi:LHFPL tetraspan subfamily member 2 protein [Trichogramma pretiosum]|uniref:Lipoma HMGIC fusion partner-like 2 protein n=1 Tax=Trichogramma kaykai TaxID=54128 RepID=A0ABD2VSQ3_9HYME|nr:LHFPL tetraspan subfamily member 2 protein [Trichogramma pretiosum]
MCCLVIVTGRSLAWTLISILAFMSVLAAVLTPKWIIGPGRPIQSDDGSKMYNPSQGIYNRCILLQGQKNHCGDFNQDGFFTDPVVFPPIWKASMFFMSFGLAIMAATVAAALLGCYVQSIGRKSIFDLCGVAQAIAGISYLFGMILYPAGWGAPRVRKMCGPEANAFYPGDCTIGYSFYLAVCGVSLTFLSAILSNQAEKSTSSDKVQEKLNEGKNLVCLL